MPDDLKIRDPQVGRVLAAQRCLMGKNQRSVAESAGIPVGSLCRIERGLQPITLRELHRLTKVLVAADSSD